MKAICLPLRNRSSFWDFLLLEADLLFEVGIPGDIVQSRGSLRVQHLKVSGKFFP